MKKSGVMWFLLKLYLKRWRYVIILEHVDKNGVIALFLVFIQDNKYFSYLVISVMIT